MIEQIFPLHDHDDLAKLRKTWVKAFFKAQPLGKKVMMNTLESEEFKMISFEVSFGREEDRRPNMT